MARLIEALAICESSYDHKSTAFIKLNLGWALEININQSR